MVTGASWAILGSPRRPSKPQSRSKEPPSSHKQAPRCLLDLSGTLPGRPRDPPDLPKCVFYRSKMHNLEHVPKCPQDAPRSPQEAPRPPKTPPKRPKRPPRQPKTPPRRPPRRAQRAPRPSLRRARKPQEATKPTRTSPGASRDPPGPPWTPRDPPRDPPGTLRMIGFRPL